MYLEVPRKNGTTLADHYAQLLKTPGAVLPEGLPDPEPPFEGLRIWEIFWELSSSRGSNGFGPNPLSFEGIESWSRLARVELELWEVAAVKAMDAAFMSEVARADKE